jgi:hypothetical protein
MSALVSSSTTNRYLHKLAEIQDGGIYLSSSANIELPKGTNICSVPWKQCISVEAALASASLGLILRENSGLLDYPDEVLALAMMFGVLQHDCPWHKHTSNMPQISDIHNPVVWNETDIELLKGHTIYHLSNLMRRQIKTDWETIHKPLSTSYPEQLGELTPELYTWALSMVYSRAIGFDRNGEYVRAIVPDLDMANHSPSAGWNGAETFSYEPETDRVVLTSTLPVKPGGQIYAHYGSYSNSKLLFSYGFVLRSGTPQCIDVWPSLGNQKIWGYQQKLELLRSTPGGFMEQNYDFSGTFRKESTDEESPVLISHKLLGQLRVLQADENDWPLIQNAFFGKIVSCKNEMSVYENLKTMLRARIDESALAEIYMELAQLTDESINSVSLSRRHMALRVRADELSLAEVAMKQVETLCDKLRAENSDYKPPDYDRNRQT